MRDLQLKKVPKEPQKRVQLEEREFPRPRDQKTGLNKLTTWIKLKAAA